MEQQKQTLNIAFPPDEVFKNRTNRVAPAQSVIGTRSDFVFDHMEYPAEGGQLAWFKDCPFPQKGHPYPQAAYAVNIPKRYFVYTIKALANKDLAPLFAVLFLLPKRRKVRIISRFLEAFVEGSAMVLTPHFLADNRYTSFGRELRKFINNFLANLGVDSVLADRFAETFVCLLEYDNVYRMFVADVLSETTLEKVLKDPAGEINRMVALLVSRRPGVEGPRSVGDKYIRLGKVVRALLWLPSFKKAFKDALKSIDFSKFQFDDADRYHSLLYSDHNYLGLPIEKRIEMYTKYHEEHPPLPPRITINP